MNIEQKPCKIDTSYIIEWIESAEFGISKLTISLATAVKSLNLTKLKKLSIFAYQAHESYTVAAFDTELTFQSATQMSSVSITGSHNMPSPRPFMEGLLHYRELNSKILELNGLDLKVPSGTSMVKKHRQKAVEENVPRTLKLAGRDDTLRSLDRTLL